MKTDLPAGFVYQYIFSTDRSARAFVKLSDDDLADPANTVWHHLDLQQPESSHWLKHQAKLEPLVSEALIATETRPRSFNAKEGLVVVLRGVNTNPGHNPEDMVSVRIWIEKNRIITTRNRTLLPITDLATALKNQEGPRTSGEFLTDLIERLADRIGDFVNQIEDELGDTEDQLESIHPNELRGTLGSLRRQIASVRRFLAPQRDALDRLNYAETDILTNRDRQRLREESDRISRYLEDLDLARERAVVLQEAFLSQLAQQQNTRMYVLSVIAAIFLPLTFVTGLLGMNVGGLPGIENQSGFSIATMVMVGATLGLIVLFKWKKWI
ncbi:zinc transporter ZntB [Arenicella xantha]|uniref:Zinc transporter n=1 Tax=Arenicella xantha TaxID=644221 RepID=A0A395JQ49_9GAMM|nr:zinc transporter ZntB [Arenicella xantha]RBP51664.1 zinc transporter [Arenicella xantha]